MPSHGPRQYTHDREASRWRENHENWKSAVFKDQAFPPLAYIHTYIHTLYLTRMHKKGHFIYSFYIIHSCTDGSAVTLSYSGLSKFKLKRLGENTYLL